MVAAYRLTTPLQDETSAESFPVGQTNWPAERIWLRPVKTSAKPEAPSAASYFRHTDRAELTDIKVSTTASAPNDDNAIWKLFQKPIGQLAEIRELQENWDENGAYPVTPLAYHAASHILSSIMFGRDRLLRVRAIPATIFPLPTGGLNIQWRNRSGLIDLEVDANGQLSLVRQRGHDMNATYEEAERLNEDDALRQVAELTLWPT